MPPSEFALGVAPYRISQTIISDTGHLWRWGMGGCDGWGRCSWGKRGRDKDEKEMQMGLDGFGVEMIKASSHETQFYEQLDAKRFG